MIRNFIDNSEYRIQNIGFRIQDSEYRIQISNFEFWHQLNTKALLIKAGKGK